MAVIVAYMTGESFDEESLAHGDARERGWVAPSWSRRIFWPMRSDVEPIFSAPEDDSELLDLVRYAVRELGAFEDNGDGTLYAADCEEDYQTGITYRYALHFSRIEADGTESDWYPFARP